jgi:short-subunit dehydrogenase
MQTVVITGATGGIGFEFCRHYKEKGFHVVGICRKATESLKKLGIDIIDDIDLTKEDSFSKVKNRLEGQVIDILINNAGLLESNSLSKINYESLRRQFEINTIAPLRMSELLQDQIANGGKIALITSRMGSIADNTSGGSYGYRASKTALNMVGVSLAHDLSNRQIWVGLLHPGYVKTKMTGMTGHITPDVAVDGMLRIIDQAKPDNTGLFWHSNGERLPW